ncbi:uncharacterized protein JCM6883_001246 [Sporobolomyces salmoneus]|uniref:uncharacterized protein n=1 Tax=Sporobolomyces salmoneus TaxID=183962 RepID=UPI00317DE574
MHLPDELLESIFSYIHEKSAEPSPESQQTFAALALTSKRFLPLARSYLYYRPVPKASTATWDQALALYSALSSHLGQLVVSLEGIVEYTAKIGTFEEPGPLSFQLRGFTKTFSFYHAIVDQCPRLVIIELSFKSRQNGRKLFKAVAKSKSTLETVVFEDASTKSHDLIAPELIVWALEQDALQRVENVIVGNVEFGLQSYRPPSTGLDVKSFISTYTFLDNLTEFLPRDPTSLRDVSIESEVLDQDDVEWILRYIPNALKKLRLHSSAYDGAHPSSFDKYLGTFYASIPPSDFVRFTSLTHLSLRYFEGPSLDLLDVLSSSCGSTLLLLDLSHCKWIPSRIATSAVPIVKTSLISCIVDPDDLLDRLREFQKLLRVHLGFLPTLERETYANLNVLTEEKGIELEWDLCTRYGVCPDCGGTH